MVQTTPVATEDWEILSRSNGWVPDTGPPSMRVFVRGPDARLNRTALEFLTQDGLSSVYLLREKTNPWLFALVATESDDNSLMLRGKGPSAGTVYIKRLRIDRKLITEPFSIPLTPTVPPNGDEHVRMLVGEIPKKYKPDTRRPRA